MFSVTLFFSKSSKILFCFLFFGGFFSSNALAEQLVPDNQKIGKINQQEFFFQDLKTAEIQKLLEEVYFLLQQNFEKKALMQKKFVLPKISDQEIKKFYDDNELKEKASFEILKPQIRSYLAQSIIQKQSAKELEKLYQSQKIQFFLSPPDLVLVQVPIGTAYLRGAKAAKVMLLEFSDYQCPFCKKNQPAITNLIKKYKKKVAFGYRHFPLSFHQEADEAAIAVECAREQGKFEIYHQLLFSDSIRWSIKKLKSYAKLVGIERQEQFDSCLDSRKYDDLLATDERIALEAGVKSTPTYIVGRVLAGNILEGQLIVGALPEQELEKAIQKYL